MYHKLDKVCSICGYKNNCISRIGTRQEQRRVKRRRMKQMLKKELKDE